MFDKTLFCDIPTGASVVYLTLFQQHKLLVIHRLIYHVIICLSDMLQNIVNDSVPAAYFNIINLQHRYRYDLNQGNIFFRYMYKM